MCGWSYLDMVNLENALGFKKLFRYFDRIIYNFRELKFYINSSEKINYIFNSTIKRYRRTDFILLIKLIQDMRQLC